MISPEFQWDLCALLNRHSIENECSMPDFLLAEMLCGVIREIGSASKKNLDWHGTRSVCHPGPAINTGGDPSRPQVEPDQWNDCRDSRPQYQAANPLEPQTPAGS